MAEVAKPVSLYTLPRLITLEQVELSSRMYALPNVHAVSKEKPRDDQVSLLASLEARQDCLLDRLRHLEEQLAAAQRHVHDSVLDPPRDDHLHHLVGDGQRLRPSGLDLLLSKIAELKRLIETMLESNWTSPHITKPDCSAPSSLIISIHSDPKFLPRGLIGFVKELERLELVELQVSQHKHSSLPENIQVPDFVQETRKNTNTGAPKSLRLVIIFKEVGRDPLIHIGGVGCDTLRGEVNGLRLLHRLYYAQKQLNIRQEQMLDIIHSGLTWNQSFEKTFEVVKDHFGTKKELEKTNAGELSIVDWAALSALANGMSKNDRKQEPVRKWLKLLPAFEGQQGTDGCSKYWDCDSLLSFLTSNHIVYSIVTHPKVFTVESMKPYLMHLEGAITKNLFLKDKKDNFYLLSVLHNAIVDLNSLAKTVGAAQGLRFASEESLRNTLGVAQGCVTPLALINDSDGPSVQFFVDEDLLNNHKSVMFHPLVNDMTTILSVAGFKNFVQRTGHKINTIPLNHAESTSSH